MELHFKGKKWLSLWLYIARATKKINKPLNYIHVFIVRSEAGGKGKRSERQRGPRKWKR